METEQHQALPEEVVEPVTFPLLFTVNGQAIPPDSIHGLFIGIRKGQGGGVVVNVDCPALGILGPDEEKSNAEHDPSVQRTVQVHGPLRNAIMPRANLGKDATELTSTHLEELKRLRGERRVEIRDRVPEETTKSDSQVKYREVPIQITTEKYQVNTWDDMEAVIAKLVQKELMVQKKFAFLMQVKPPIAISAGDSKLVQLTENLVGYEVVT